MARWKFAMAIVKSQSAMEYLMTYGWAILIIAVVLGALFELGFFNSANLAPKLSPGGCQVYRPQGPGTTAFEGLEGTCNNQLPQYVAQLNGVSGYLNGSGAFAFPLSASAWIYPTSYGFSGYEAIMEFDGPNPAGATINLPYIPTGRSWDGMVITNYPFRLQCF